MGIDDELKRALERYDQAVSQSDLSEAQVDALFENAEALVPNARLSELYFYGERERSHDEVVEEALLREALWSREGEHAVLLRVQVQAQAALDDPGASVTTKVICKQVLMGVEEELEELRRRLN